MAWDVRYLEEIALADAAFEARGDSLAELFVAGAHGLLEVMVDTRTVELRLERRVSREAALLSELFFDWLSEVIFLKDAEGLLFGNAAAVVEGDGAGPWHLDATLRGEPIAYDRHQVRSDVKAVTKHLYDMRREDERWYARVVLDL